jgi:hypothetical protein
MIHKETTCFAVMSPDDPVLTGNETYPIYGPDNSKIVRFVRSERGPIMKKMKGLNRHYGCMEKALILRSHIKDGVVAMGSLNIWNKDRSGSYAYYYNPPYEFHAWVVMHHPTFIIDFGLPGAIEKGLITADHIGPVLVDIEPFILCGQSPEWIEYKVHKYLDMEECRELAKNFSLDI